MKHAFYPLERSFNTGSVDDVRGGRLPAGMKSMSRWERSAQPMSRGTGPFGSPTVKTGMAGSVGTDAGRLIGLVVGRHAKSVWIMSII